MPSNSTPIIKALGLATEPNQLDASPGSLVQASNVVIRRDDVIEPRRGFKTYGTSMGTSTDRANQIMEYRNRLLRHYSNILQFDTNTLNEDGESVFDSFAGTYNEVQAGLRIKSIQANNNFYFTTDQGIKKISAASADDLSTADGFITNAGGLKALDIFAYLNYVYGSSTGFLPNDSVVAYRVVWGETDANDNLILGTPSSPAIVYNPLQQMLVRDLMEMLYALDQLNTTGSKYTNGNYVETFGLPLGATADEIRLNLVNLAQTLDQEEGVLFDDTDIASAAISGGTCTIMMANGIAVFGKVAVGDKIFLQGFTPATSGTLDGIQTVSAVSNDGTNSFIAFETTATGAVSLSTESIESGWFRSISVPNEPATPPTHDQLQALQDYMLDIITELQSNHNLQLVANNDAVAEQNPLEITTAAVTGTTTLTINFDTAPTDTDAQNQFEVGDLVYLAGTWTTAGAENISGFQTVATVSAGNITITLSPAVTNGAVTIDTTSTVSRILRYTDELRTEFLDPLTVTTTATTFVDITVPAEATTRNFYQIYRSTIITATGTDVLEELVPSDEMKLVYENFPTQAQIDSRQIIIEDIVPESFAQGAANLYTNEISGEGILQANDVPPLAKDINVFKNYTWYANTKTRNRISTFLLGVSGIIEDYDDTLNPSVSVISQTATNEYMFVKGAPEITEVETVSGASLASSGTADYFLINGGNNLREYYFWYSIGTATDPAIADKTGIVIYAEATDTDDQIAQKTSDRLNTIVDDFTATYSTNTFTVTNVVDGPADNFDPGTTGFTVNSVTEGEGENIEQQVTSITCVAGNQYATSGTADYFTINTAFDRQRYAFWFNVAGGTMVAPVLPTRTIIPVDIINTDTNAQVATKVAAEIEDTGLFTTDVNSNIITATNVIYGPATNATESVTAGGFAISTPTAGALDVLLSSSVSPAIAVDETSRSLIHVMNRNNGEIVNGFYLSGLSDTPGNILFESIGLSAIPFYFLANQARTGNSFNPNIPPAIINISNSAADPTVVTATGHTLSDGDQVIITHSNSFPSIDGVYTVSNVVAGVSFTVPVQVIVGGTEGAIQYAVDAEVSNNEEKPNRIYYSKLQQPEAVPIVNYLDVGSANKEILRIFPLRDSLFVFKEDGLFRISSETPPWNLALFDGTLQVVAPDSLGTANNLIYVWVREGITTVSESGSQLISRPIDTLILPISSSNLYPFFSTATWGVGYSSENAYLVFTTENIEDEVATICYRYSNLTGTWTTFDKSNTCGITKQSDDKLYLGAGDVNYIEQERKSFTRFDYADREYAKELLIDNYFQNGSSIRLTDITNVEEGDVITQDQTITVYTYNQLLKKLDLDPQIQDNDYFSTLQMVGGDNVREKLEALAEKLDSDTGLSNIQTFGPGDVDTGTETITINNHGFTDDQPVRFTTTGTLPGGLNSTDFFYIINSATNTFQLSTTIGGSAVNLSSTGTGTQTITHSQYQYAIVARANYPITNITADNPTVITSGSHGMVEGRIIVITGTSSTPVINGRHIVENPSTNTFEIDEEVFSPGSTGAFSTLEQNFEDCRICYNAIISLLNTDSGAAFSNYAPITTTTTQESIIVTLNKFTKILTLTPSLDLVQGPLTVFEHINSDFIYTPLTLGDPVSYKQIHTATMMFQNKTFTSAVLSFSTDLLPEFVDIPFSGLGNGLFGNQPFGENFFGGDSHAAPFRTYVPRQCQRCRYLNIRFNHRIAREKYSVYGISLTGRVGLSSRAYR